MTQTFITIADAPRRRTPLYVALMILIALICCLAACGGGDERPAPRPTPVTPLERGIQQARQQMAKNIYTIARRDGGELTQEDIVFIRNNVTRDRVYSGLTEDRRYIIISMHIPLPPENIVALQDRYEVAQVQT